MRPIAAVLAACLAVLCVSDPAVAAHPPPAAADEGLGLPLPRYDRISSPYGWRVGGFTGEGQRVKRSGSARLCQAP